MPTPPTMPAPPGSPGSSEIERDRKTEAGIQNTGYGTRKTMRRKRKRKRKR
jgi:hypothetical protein